MKPVQIGIVGCGNIGKRHVAVADAEPGANILAVCDSDEAVMKHYRDEYQIAHGFTRFDDMLALPDLELVNICTPHAWHATMAIQAMRAGKHVLVEKPMALHGSDSQKMIDVSKETGRKLMVVKQNRYNVPVSITKEALDAGRLGKIFMVQCHVLWNRHQGYYNESPWRGQLKEEGGALHTQASHFIDLLIWWFGDVVHANTALATRNHAIEIEDCGQAHLEFASGVMGSLVWTTCVYNKNFEGSITIIGENGTIKIGGQYLNKIEFWDVASFPLPAVDFNDKPNAYGKYQGTSSNHHFVLHDAVAAVRGDNKQNQIVYGEEGMKTIEAIEKIYQHARKLA